jgi:hypothetical protein
MLYGEGNHAFRRLQEEIIKTTPDFSIFAWRIMPPTYHPQTHQECVYGGVLASDGNRSSDLLAGPDQGRQIRNFRVSGWLLAIRGSRPPNLPGTT